MAMQIDEETRSSLEVLFTVFIVFMTPIVIGTIVLGIFSGIGYILPIWMLVNSVQLIAYTVLLDMPFASNATYLMRRFLDALRINGNKDLYEIEDVDA